MRYYWTSIKRQWFYLTFLLWKRKYKYSAVLYPIQLTSKRSWKRYRITGINYWFPNYENARNHLRDLHLRFCSSSNFSFINAASISKSKEHLRTGSMRVSLVLLISVESAIPENQKITKGFFHSKMNAIRTIHFNSINCGNNKFVTI